MTSVIENNSGSSMAGAHKEAESGWDKLQRYTSGKWQFLWRMPETREQIVCDFWRHRREIGYIHNITDGPHQAMLLARTLADYRQRRVALVLTTPAGSGSEERVWQTQGFQPVEEVVQYQRILTEEPHSFCESLDFRRYNYYDRDAVLAVEREAFPWIWWSGAEELNWYDRLLGTQFWVVTQGVGGEVIGLLGMTVSLGVGHIDRIAVLSRCQGRGYGRRILSFGLNQFWRRGVRRVTLLTQSDNHRAQDLYSRAGFAATSWRQRFDGLWLDSAVMAAVERRRAL